MINGTRIRQARELNRLTQAELAEEIGVAQTTIGHIEAGRFQPSPDVVKALALRLGVPEPFFERSDPPHSEGSLCFADTLTLRWLTSEKPSTLLR